MRRASFVFAVRLDRRFPEPPLTERLPAPTTIEEASRLCVACGACCAHDPEWPRFSLETDEALAAIPAALVDDDAGRMRFVDGRCAALAGTIGEGVACTCYQVRPLVCREAMPGDPECNIAREARGFPPIEAGEWF